MQVRGYTLFWRKMAYFAVFSAEFGQKTDPKAHFSLIFSKTSMKQTNNAIKFLMAQYRAIFKNAYFKGLTSAVLLTAGLAAGAAQAAAPTWGTTNDTETDVTITDDQTVSGGKDVFANDLTITGTGSLTLSGASSRIVVNSNMILQSGAKLTIDESNGQSGIQGSNNISGTGDAIFNTANTQFTATGATITSSKAGIQFTNMSLTDTTVTLNSGAGIGAYAGGNYAGTRGVLRIDGDSKVTLGSGAYAYGNQVTIGQGTSIIMQGESAKATAGMTAGGLAEIYSSGQNNHLDMNGALTVDEGKYGRLGGAIINLNAGSNITNKGTLILGTAGEDNKVVLNDGATVQINGKASGHIYAASDIVMNGGNLTLNTTDGKFGLVGVSAPENYNAGTLGTFDTDFTATGGVINITKSQLQMNNITLGGDVQVTIGTHIGDKDSYWTDNSIINAEDNNDGTSGILTINGADITMNAGSSIMGRNVVMTDGSISLNGSDDAYDQNESGSAMVTAYGSTSKLDLQGGEITVATDKFGAIRGKTINLSGVAITNNGELTIAGVLDGNESGANAVKQDGQAIFNMTAGSINNAGTLNLGVVSGSGVDNKSSVFTFAGGTVTNSDTINVGSGAGFNTAGTFSLAGNTGTLKLLSGSTATLGGDNVTLAGNIDVASGANVNVTGKVTYTGDASSATDNTVDLTVANSGNFTISNTATFTVADAKNTLGLNISKADPESEDIFTVSKGTGFAGFDSISSGVLYVDVESALSGLGYTTNADGSYTLTSEEFADLSGKLSSTLAGAGNKLTINLEGVNVSLPSDAVDTENNTADYNDIANVVANGSTPTQLANTSVNVDNANNNVTGSFGQVQMTTGNNVDVSGKHALTLNGHEVNGESQGSALVQVGSGDTATVGGATLKAGSQLNLNVQNGTGTISSITASYDATNADSAGTVAVQAGSTIAVVAANTNANSVKDGVAADFRRGDIGSTGAQLSEVAAGGNLTVGSVYAKTTNVTSTGVLDATNITTEAANVAATAALVAKTVTTTTADFKGTTKVETMTANGAATFDGGVHTITKTLTTNDALAIDNGATLDASAGKINATQGLTVTGGATVIANSVEANGNIFVGSDTATPEADDGAGTFVTNFLNLNGNDIVIDPSWHSSTGSSIAAIGKFASASSTNVEDAGVANGSLYALQNSVLGVGFVDEDEAATRAAIQARLAPLFNTEGNLDRDNVGAVLYVADKFTVGQNHRIVVDPSLTDATYQEHTQNYANNALYIAKNAAVAVELSAADDSTQAAITFEGANATIHVDDGTSKIILVGDYTVADTINLFQDAGTGGDDSLVDIIGNKNSLRVETLNGLFYQDVTGQIGVLSDEGWLIDHDRVDTVFAKASAPVRDTMVTYLYGDTNWAEMDEPGYKENPLRGDAIEGVYVTTQGKLVDKDGKEISQEMYEKIGDNYNYIREEGVTDPVQIYWDASNEFLDKAEVATDGGIGVETAARMGDFAGAAQVALAVGSTTTNAIAGRMGVGAANSSMTFADNGQGAGLWVTPIYMSSDSDGFDAQGTSYGTDISLYGVALGADYTLSNGLRFGAMFNVGSGDADGQGNGSLVSNEFDYYGFGVYAGYTLGAMSLLADVSYSVADNDATANVGYDTLSTSFDSSNLSLGITGLYAVETGSVTVTPHAGLRFSSIDIDDYVVDGAKYDVGSYDADTLNVFSIPVGVTIASDIQLDAWTVKPSFDFTVTGNFGDDETEGSFHWDGISNYSTSLTSEVLDNVTYGASLGVAAQNGNFSFGVGLNYTGSSNVDTFGVQANARFVF